MFMANFLGRSLMLWLSLCISFWLVACSSQPGVPQPVELGPSPALLGVKQVWAAQTGRVDFPLSVVVTDNTVVLAGGPDGKVSAVNAATGAVLWQVQLGVAVSAGVGSDGHYAALVTQDNALVTLENGKESWRIRLASQVLTAPLVAGGRVFVLAGDRSVAAFDARTGHKLWSDQHPGDNLLLRQAGVLTAVGNTLVVGLGGTLTGLDPNGGQTLWSVAIARPRGTNDVERLVDLVAGVARNGNTVCVRAFQAAVGCVDVAQGRLGWRQTASGFVGLHGDGQTVFGVEGDGRVLAWQQTTGQQQWASDALRYRQLSAPLALGRSVIVGDDAGRLHFLSRTDGSVLTRLSTDGSPIVTTPVVAGQTLVVVTRNGGIFGFRPE
ncbi:MAG: outer membrane protein assembly factor BamB [Comamonadaceae bacterium CG1_02_60_18]|nr:MAG: outer membrane protein assembly factor BamB [Comamonadaceae bacterium CG1_02_60_18]PIQ54928.1 MAG: outer membrane protein assembly factor BamB [Comamonadaceae bacterium CG12_big_fil_rev_8_21_14_0_65_59_15]